MTRAQLHQWADFNRPHKRSRLRRAWAWLNSSPGPLLSLAVCAMELIMVLIGFALMFAWAFQVFTRSPLSGP